MTAQEVSALVAAISLVTNVVMAIALYRLNRRGVALGDLIAKLRPLLEELERTRLFEMLPEDEIWEFGFQTLNTLADRCASAHIAAQLSRFADQSLRTAIAGLHDHVKGLREFQDRWRVFSQPRKGEDYRALQREWPDFPAATAALRAARPAEQQCKRSLSQFLAKHGASA